MTAATLPASNQTARTSPSQPDPRRLLAAAIVGGVGVIALSTGVGRFVVASRSNLPSSLAGDAHGLVAAVPWLVLIALGHLAVAWGVASHRRTARTAGTLVTGALSVIAVATAVLALAGIDPLGWVRDAPRPPVALAELAVLAALYGTATALALAGRRS
ncbi:MAG TPA: hypothetical protein VFP22_11200 [Candidatus Limnocylindrales bacterium]|nr:hypothetical protein [Candidatus Limnocylindrales bacterium]